MKDILKSGIRKMTIQANNMKERSSSRFDQASWNSTVLVPVPTEDKAKLDSYNFLAVVLEIIEDGT